MVTTTSAARTTSSVSGFGYSPASGTPISSSAVRIDPADFAGGLGTGGAHVHAVAGELAEDRRRQLGAAGVLHADEQHLRHAVRPRLVGLVREGVEAVRSELGGQRRQMTSAAGREASSS